MWTVRPSLVTTWNEKPGLNPSGMVMVYCSSGGFFASTNVHFFAFVMVSCSSGGVSASLAAAKHFLQLNDGRLAESHVCGASTYAALPWSSAVPLDRAIGGVVAPSCNSAMDPLLRTRVSEGIATVSSKSPTRRECIVVVLGVTTSSQAVLRLEVALRGVATAISG